MEILENVRIIKYATFWQRFAASFIDGIILAIPVAILSYALSLPPVISFRDGVIHYTYFSTSNMVNVVIGWLYHAIMESGQQGATIGKRAMGLRVTDMDGNRIGFGQATGRHFGKIISAAILLIGYLMMLWNDKKQTLHDKMAGTLVLER